MTVYRNDIVHFETVSNVTASPSVDVGTRRVEGDEEYIYVYNNGNSQINPGNGAILTAVTGYSVTLSSLTNTQFFGVCKHATLTTTTYGWLLRRGFVEGKMHADESAAVGALLGPGVDGVFAVTTQTTLAFGVPCAKAMSAVASGASGSMYFNAF